MRCLAAVVVLVACGGGQSPPDGGNNPGDPPPLPLDCQGRCIIDEPVGGFGFEDCCDSVTCYLDHDTNQWVIELCDSPLDPCVDCLSDQICVQRFDGTCTGTTTCEPFPVKLACPPGACSPECEAMFCTSPFQCQNTQICGTESLSSFKCYGP